MNAGAVRRVVSVVLYAIAGIVLSCMGLMLFILTPDPLLLYYFALPPSAVGLGALGLGAAISPGPRRSYEIGLTLLISAGAAAAMTGTIALLIFMPDTRPLFPEREEPFFTGAGAGTSALFLATLLGIALMRRGRSTVDRELGGD